MGWGGECDCSPVLHTVDIFKRHIGKLCVFVSLFNYVFVMSFLTEIEQPVSNITIFVNMCQ